MDQATDETDQALSHDDLMFRCQRTRSLVIKGAVAWSVTLEVAARAAEGTSRFTRFSWNCKDWKFT